MSQEKLLTLLIKRFEQGKQKDKINERSIYWVLYFQKINFVLVITLSLLLFSFGLGGLPVKEPHRPVMSLVFGGFFFLFIAVYIFFGLVIGSKERHENPRWFRHISPPSARTTGYWYKDEIEETEKEIIEELKDRKKTIDELKEGLEKTKN